MNSFLNPFSPGAGTPPPALVGRQDLLSQAKLAIERIRCWKRETRPQAEKVEEMLLKMGFKPLSPEIRSQLIAAGHYGMPQD